MTYFITLPEIQKSEALISDMKLVAEKDNCIFEAVAGKVSPKTGSEIIVQTDSLKVFVLLCVCFGGKKISNLN